MVFLTPSDVSIFVLHNVSPAAIEHVVVTEEQWTGHINENMRVLFVGYTVAVSATEKKLLQPGEHYTFNCMAFTHTSLDFVTSVS